MGCIQPPGHSWPCCSLCAPPISNHTSPALRCVLQEITTLLPFSGISLDILPDSSDLGADLSDYVHHRVNSSTHIAANVTTPTGAVPDQLLLSKFSSHLSTRSHGSFLYLQLTLDLFHKGHLVLKGGNYLVVPVSLSEVRHQHEKLKFKSSLWSSRKVSLHATSNTKCQTSCCCMLKAKTSLIFINFVDFFIILYFIIFFYYQYF